MKKISLLIITAAIFAWIMGFGCGGGAGTTAGGDDLGNPSIDDPAGDENLHGDGGTDTGGADEIPLPDVTPAKVLIIGALIDAENVGISNATITFHSDPFSVVTDAGGIFEALLEAGEHTFEVTGSTLENISGTITVTATDIMNGTGQVVGTFAAVVLSGAVSDNEVCKALRLKDLGETMVTNTAAGIIEGTFGNEVDSQGNNQTEAIVGNSEMVANVSIDGRLSGLWFPTVGAYNHVPYLSKADDWVKPFQGSFGGIKRGNYYYWFTDRDYWNAPAIQYQSGTFAPIIEITHTGKGDCSGGSVKEKYYVVYNDYGTPGNKANVLMRDFQVTAPSSLSSLCQTTANRTFSPELALYSRFNPSSINQLFHQWIPDLTIPACSTDRMYWAQLHGPQYTIVTEGLTSTGTKLAMTCSNVTSITEARNVVPDTACFPLSIIGSIAKWSIPPATKRILVATAGCGLAGTPCNSALDSVETSVGTLENSVKTGWNTWLAGIETISDSTWNSRYKRWLVSMKMLADKNTGAIIASPSQEPTYYPSWPRDGVYQAVAYIMAKKYSEAALFFKYLFDNTYQTQSSDNGWTQAHSSLDGSELGLPSIPARLNIEEDQPPTVLWGLWVYWKKVGALPAGVTIDDVKDVAKYVTDRICPASGLIQPSLDWHENPYKDIGQSLYTNAAAHAGLLAAAKMVESTDAAAAANYRSAARTIKTGVETRLCGSVSCYGRIKYDYSKIPELGDLNASCNHCLSSTFSTAENEKVMAFAWPFHLFPLGDSKVQSYYNDTKLTYDDFSEFSNCKSLWIPRYLFSYLYASEAAANSEVPAGAYKTTLGSDITAIESIFPDIMTDIGYLMDQYIDGDEGNIYGPEYAGARLGSSARPLGWSQAMGILVALARDGKRIDMIGETAAECTTGACCDATGHFKASTQSCGTPTTEYGCPDGTACGADVKNRTVTRYCSGSSAACDGAFVNGAWSTAAYDNCSTSEMCVAGNPVCQPCGACVHACSTGETKCEGSRAYSCTTNASGCRVWDSGTNCGTSGYGSNYCYDNDVYHDYTTRGCSSGECTESTSPRTKVTECGTLGCSGGVCNTDCPIYSWPNNDLTAMDVGGGISLMWEPPSTGSWVDHYTIARRGGNIEVPQEGDAIATTTDTSYIDRTAPRGSWYRYVVFAWRNCGPHGVGSTIATVNY